MRLKHNYVSRDHRYSPLRIVLIGSGGNGSAVLAGLPYLHHAMRAWGLGQGLMVTVLDGDTVSPTNCVRQPFGCNDVGQPKATVLVSRINLFHGFTWKANPAYFTPELYVENAGNGFDLAISCVDTRATRKAIHESFENTAGPWSTVRYWLDLGNNASNGQFVLGQPLNRINPRRRERLRTVAELFPAVVDLTSGEDPQPSCSAAEALDRQEPFINNVLASSALAMLTRMIRYGEIDHHGAFYNAQTGRAVPLSIDPDAWERTRRRTRHNKSAA